MAWATSDTTMRMSEGDFGIALPFTIQGITIDAADTIKFEFKAQPNAATIILTKEYTNIHDNGGDLSLTAAESALFTPGVYCYNMSWSKNGVFQYNLVENGIFKVGDVA